VVSKNTTYAIIYPFQDRTFAWEKDMPNNANGNSIQDFLTPEAMLTPGVAGSMTMMITNALATNFDMPRAWLGLGLSFVFGLLVLVSTKALLLKALFYVLNSLVIFCVAVGANGLGTGGAPVQGHTLLFGIAPAYAQTTTAPATSTQNIEHCANISATVDAAQKRGASSDQVLDLIRPCQSLSQDLLQKKNASIPSSAEINSDAKVSAKFFSPWKF
jgi:hypothetical protein